MAEQKTTEVKTRNKRKPFGVPRTKLSVDNQDPAYHYRWVNDEPGRIAQALEGDYTFVEPQEVNRTSKDGNRVRELAGKLEDGSAMYTYLMKIPREYFEEDQQASQSYLDDIDAAIRGGKINAGANDKRYVPEGGISIKTK
jgi:hypothetical protein